MKKTMQEKLAAALIARGEREIPIRSGKRRKFTRQEGGYWFIGKAGSLRSGRSVSDSISRNEATKRRILEPPQMRTADCGAAYGMPVAAKLLTK